MSSDINLISPKNESSLIEKKRLKILRTISYVIAGLVVLFALLIFAVNATFSTSKVKKQQEEAVAQLLMLKDKSAKLYIINNRIVTITKIINDRNNSKKLEDLIKVVPNDVKINNINFDDEGISLTLSSTSLLPLDKVINKYIDKASKREIIKTFSIGSLSMNKKSGSYLLTVKADFL
jgi:Tfp pilus assembly protein PilN